MIHLLQLLAIVIGAVIMKCEITLGEVIEISPIYTLDGIPQPLKRPRFFERRVYDSQKHSKLLAGLKLKQQHNERDPFNGILHMDVTFYFPYPKDKKKKKELKKQAYHIYRPDLSNLIKMVEDVCVDAEIITDDSIIASISSIKLYDDKPRTTFSIKCIKGNQ